MDGKGQTRSRGSRRHCHGFTLHACCCCSHHCLWINGDSVSKSLLRTSCDAKEGVSPKESVVFVLSDSVSEFIWQRPSVSMKFAGINIIVVSYKGRVCTKRLVYELGIALSCCVHHTVSSNPRQHFRPCRFVYACICACCYVRINAAAALCGSFCRRVLRPREMMLQTPSLSSSSFLLLSSSSS